MAQRSMIARGRGGSVEVGPVSFLGKTITQLDFTGIPAAVWGGTSGNRRTAALAPNGPVDLILKTVGDVGTIVMYPAVPSGNTTTWSIYIEGDYMVDSDGGDSPSENEQDIVERLNRLFDDIGTTPAASSDDVMSIDVVDPDQTNGYETITFPSIDFGAITIAATGITRYHTEGNEKAREIG